MGEVYRMHLPRTLVVCAAFGLSRRRSLWPHEKGNVLGPTLYHIFKELRVRIIRDKGPIWRCDGALLGGPSQLDRQRQQSGVSRSSPHASVRRSCFSRHLRQLYSFFGTLRGECVVSLGPEDGTGATGQSRNRLARDKMAVAASRHALLKGS